MNARPGLTPRYPPTGPGPGRSGVVLPRPAGGRVHHRGHFGSQQTAKFTVFTSSANIQVEFLKMAADAICAGSRTLGDKCTRAQAGCAR